MRPLRRSGPGEPDALVEEQPHGEEAGRTGEAQASKFVQQILSSEKFVSYIQTVVQTTLSAKGSFNRNIRAALSAMNLPSSANLEQIRGKVSDLESVLAQLDEKVSQLIERLPEKSEKKGKASAYSPGSHPCGASPSSTRRVAPARPPSA